MIQIIISNRMGVVEDTTDSASSTISVGIEITTYFFRIKAKLASAIKSS